jgi:hypothetical protein
MNTDFPEDLFPAVNNYYKFKHGIEAGKKIASENTILFCGVVRNADQYIERNILRLLRTAKFFKSFHIYIYENDSEDNTKNILSKYRDKYSIVMENNISDDYLEQFRNGSDKNHFLRCNRIAKCRNKYIDFLQDNIFNYVCILDLDIRGGWSYDGFFDSMSLLNNDSNISCVTSYGVLADYRNNNQLESVRNNKYIMYDSFAFRPYNFKHEMNANLQSSFNFIETYRGDLPIKVFSNFNGLGIYKYNVLKNKNYEVRIHDNNFVDCDHVIMNEKIRNEGGTIILNPNLIVSYAHHRYSQI